MYKASFFVIISLLIFNGCNNINLTQIENSGYAQGSTFQIKYLSANGVDFEKEIIQLLDSIDKSMSTYKETSLISNINKGDTSILIDPLFKAVWERSLDIHQEVDGDFDPTIGPLVRLWGFGLSEKQNVDTAQIDSMKQYIGVEAAKYSKGKLEIPKGYSIDFNAIAQGYTVDVIANYLESQGITNYMVEVGGEVRAKGYNAQKQIWRIGIDKPSADIDTEDRFQTIITLKDAALATSGNYRKFWVDSTTGIKYAHTINPHSGFPAMNTLLSASIIAPTAMDADAYATVCMVKGTQKAIQFLNGKKELEGYLVYTDEEGNWQVYQTEGFKNYQLP